VENAVSFKAGREEVNVKKKSYELFFKIIYFNGTVYGENI
jgi:hypothetical protein